MWSGGLLVVGAGCVLGGWFDVGRTSLLGTINKPESLLPLLKHQNQMKAAGSMEPLGSDAVVCVQRV